MDHIEQRVQTLVAFIRNACIICGLNITIFDGKIGFVDQKSKKIVAAWAPEYTVDDIPCQIEEATDGNS